MHTEGDPSWCKQWLLHSCFLTQHSLCACITVGIADYSSFRTVDDFDHLQLLRCATFVGYSRSLRFVAQPVNRGSSKLYTCTAAGVIAIALVRVVLCLCLYSVIVCRVELACVLFADDVFGLFVQFLAFGKSSW